MAFNSEGLTMTVHRNRLTYLALIIIVLIAGLCSRYFTGYLPGWINLCLGDVLWALIVFFLFGFIFSAKKTSFIAAIALLFSSGIELSQLYHSPWIDALRHTMLGGLVLGFGFLWSDLVAYSVGIAIGILIERFIILK